MTSTVARAGTPARAGAVHSLVARGIVGPAVIGAAGAGVVATAAGLIVLAADNAWTLPASAELPVDAAAGLTCSVMGAFVALARRPTAGSRWVGAVLLVAGVCAGLAVAASATVVVAREVDTAVLVAADLAGWLWVPGFVPLLALVPLVHPDGLPPGRRWRAAAAAGVAGTVLLAGAMALHPTRSVGRTEVVAPLAHPGVARVLAVPAGLLLVVAVAAGLVATVARVRRSRGLARRQVVVVAAPAAVLLAVTLAQGALPSPADVLAQALAVALVPVALGVAVTRHRLYDLDLAVCRALVGVSLALCLTGAYLTVFGALRALSPDGGDVLTALAAGVTGLLVQPLSSRLTVGADRLFYGDRGDPYAVSARLTARLSEGPDVDEVPRVICGTVLEALRLGSVAVAVEVHGRERVLASSGEPTGPTERFALRHRGEPVGALLVTPRRGEDVVPTRDAELLATLADQAGPAVAALRLTESLRGSREALVAAREEERRRLRRDLHDGVGAALAGARLQLETAHDLATDPVVARLIGGATAGVVQAVQDVRHITEDLRPAAIDELGLPGALAALADRSSTPDLHVGVTVEDLPPVAAAVEVALYRIAAESVANAVRHARARRVDVQVRTEAAAVTLTVADDGVGIGGGPGTDTAVGRGHGSSRPGLGLASMRARAEELGGALTLADGHPGTVVRARLPLRVAP